MAERKISGNDMLLFGGRTPGVFDLIVCLTANSITRTTNEIDAKSKCGPDKLAGTQDNGVTFEGQVMVDPDSGRVSIDDLTDWWQEKATIYWKMGKVTPLEGDITYTFTGFVSKLDEAYAQDVPGTFSGAIGVNGFLSKTTATS